jgi:hypothetical protein
MTQEELGQFLFERTNKILNLTGFCFQAMKRKAPIKDPKKSFRIAYINLKTKKVVLDLYSPQERRPKKPSVILRTLAHELAHYQKPPYRQLWRRRIINRSHYPAYYRQVNRNIKKFQKDKILSQFFT